MAEVAEVSEVAMVAMVAMVAVVRGNSSRLSRKSNIHSNQNKFHNKVHRIQTVRAHASLRACPKSRPACQRCLGSQR